MATWIGERPNTQHCPSGGCIGPRRAKDWNMDAKRLGRRDGPRCDACGAACGSFVLLARHLSKKAAAYPKHAGQKEIIEAQAERIAALLEAR